MKTLLSVTLISVLLVGCALPQKYDNNEYESWVRMQVLTEELVALCETGSKAQIDAALAELRREARISEVYAQYTPRNAEVSTAAGIIAEDVNEIREFYAGNDHNVTYCTRKADLLGKKINTMVEVIPQKKR